MVCVEIRFTEDAPLTREGNLAWLPAFLNSTLQYDWKATFVIRARQEEEDK